MTRAGAQARPRLDQLTVFVVEDHAFQRGGLVTMLRALGVQQIGEAANGLEALAQLQSHKGEGPPDVILCDLDMPEMDGIEFLRVVAGRKLARAVVIVSGCEEEILWSVETMARASGLAVIGRLRKPPSLQGLLELLSRDREKLPDYREVPQTPLDSTELRRALAADEFGCEFQPKVHLVTGDLVGVEALARWRRADGLLVPPGKFVPAMVCAGLIGGLTDRILDEACRALIAWGAKGLMPNVSVNVSMSTLADLGTADRFLAQVRSHGLDPRRITFEVTETEVMTDLASVLHVMTRLRLKGFRLAIDDFGIGYSSLAQLSAIPFTELKLDQTFVRGCERSQRLRDIIQASIELARRLHIHTVAEGIETEDEWKFLRRVGCDEGQGFYIARPMLAADIPRWSVAWSDRMGQEG